MLAPQNVKITQEESEPREGLWTRCVPALLAVIPQLLLTVHVAPEGD